MQDFEYSFGTKIFCLRQKKTIAKFAKRKPETDMIVKEPHALPIFIALTYHKHKKVQFMFFFLSPSVNLSFSEIFLLNRPKKYPSKCRNKFKHIFSRILFQKTGIFP